MICVIVNLTVRAESDAAKVKELLLEASRLSRAEPGCSRFDVYQDNADPKLFVLCEHWADIDALNAHREAKAYTTVYQPHVIPLVERSSKQYTLVSGG